MTSGQLEGGHPPEATTVGPTDVATGARRMPPATSQSTTMATGAGRTYTMITQATLDTLETNRPLREKSRLPDPGACPRLVPQTMNTT